VLLPSSAGFASNAEFARERGKAINIKMKPNVSNTNDASAALSIVEADQTKKTPMTKAITLNNHIPIPN